MSSSDSATNLSASGTPLNPFASETPISVSTKLFASSIPQLCSIKLDCNNFLLWNCSILPVIRGHKMEGYLLGTKHCPPKTIAEGTMIKPNPAYKEWVSFDQLLMGWIYNTLTPNIASQLIGYTTSSGLWTAIRSLAGAHTRSKITLLKGELHRTRKRVS